MVHLGAVAGRCVIEGAFAVEVCYWGSPRYSGLLGEAGPAGGGAAVEDSGAEPGTIGAVDSVRRRPVGLLPPQGRCCSLGYRRASGMLLQICHHI